VPALTSTTAFLNATSASVNASVAYDALFPDVPVWQWASAHVEEWLDAALGLPQYQHRFREAAVDGPVLLSLRDSDLTHLLGVQHPLHRRKIELAIRKLQDRGE
jgi:hypothetical protein